MDALLSLILGLVLSTLYTSHLYYQARHFPSSNIFAGFLLRLLLACVFMLFILLYFQKEGLLMAMLGFLLGRFGFLLFGVIYKRGSSEQSYKADK